MTGTEVTVERVGVDQVTVRAPFLADLVRDAITDAWAPEWRAGFEEFGYAAAQLQKSVQADECLPGPLVVSEETERLAADAERAWADLDLGVVAFLPLDAARALYQALGVVLPADTGTVIRHIPAGRAA